MPKDNKPKKRDGAPAITDARFANFETDPRFQLPSKKNLKTKLDKRFSKVLKDAEFTAVAKVDRYGRKLKTDTKKKALERLYEDESEDATDNEAKEKASKGKKDEAEDESDFEVEDDDIVQRELEAANSYDPARGGGFSSSDDDSDSDSSDSEDEKPEVEDEADAETRPGIRLRKDKEAVEEGEITNRVAIVNIDWDHIKSIDLFALFSSFVPPGGRIEKVSVYPSEFGKQRMQREELEGPPQEIFKKKSDSDSDSDSEDSDSDEAIKKELLEEGDDQDFDSDALRTYQLDRLRYYYAVMVCSDKNTAYKIYEATDGNEYLSSSNFLDLRFVPDDVTFDDEPRDECDSVPAGYKPVEFVTDALQHSKVKLTWDTNPEDYSRKEALKKAFTGSRNDIAENDLRAYLASDSSDDEEDEEEKEQFEAEGAAAEEAEEEKTLSKKELARRKMRAALGLADEPVVKSKKDTPVGEMQITFTPALSANDKKKGDEDREETTIEKYKRKERERKERKRQEMLARREGRDPNAAPQQEEEQGDQGEDLGFDDPFFTAEPVVPSKTAIRKEERLKKKAEREAEEAANAAEKAQLELLMADENGDSGRLDHFDMKQIAKVEKVKGKKKGKKGKKGVEGNDGLQEEFAMDVEDPRFKAVFESHEFAIDPSNPKFTATQGMKKLLEEGRKKRKDGPSVTEKSEKSAKKVKTDDADIDGLINSVKRKAKAKAKK
ncbi:hypothetical protein GE21DRAFT_6024 [Neurospora crassa]|uniref:Pre-rRNA processing protein Esf1 n=1 Tax=Neurospora crassa (strain ATCC 24698 / 74-OR23-1A / CBS 708.71 / DSM 1257 / FGSC 987) TaxID=367110 RepID=Q7RYC2_NEUCR|nr:pre-rRNA processing protein Esf1 [Neurospora crassa OR74A]EAA27818.1 pre-rRNA processing protein Esf1 [Neurospora crassa OR74A]KHE88642.1 hypothetical protein GE21DRAFT_6024 [Neurospora crassa]|eukprot:XP_957054.1 pre-rRNA processing protein Esf1 [Neurospora crassa OR74A]